MSVRALTTAFAVAAALELAGVIGLLVGMGGIVAAASRAGGAFLFVAYVAAMVALALNMGWMWADLFLVGHHRPRALPDVLDGTDEAVVGRLGIGMLVAWLANIGFLLLAVAVGRTRALPRAHLDRPGRRRRRDAGARCPWTAPATTWSSASAWPSPPARRCAAPHSRRTRPRPSSARRPCELGDRALHLGPT